MSSESAEIKFANSVQSVAQEIMGPDFSIEKPWRIPHFRDYNPLLKEVIEQRKQFYSDSEWNSRALCHSIIHKFMKNVDRQVAYAVAAVPWTISIMILSKDESFKDFSDNQLRLILDLAIGVAVDDRYDRHVQTQRNAAYESSPKAQQRIMEASNGWKEASEEWKKFQNKLRERIAPTDGKERK